MFKNHSKNGFKNFKNDSNYKNFETFKNPSNCSIVQKLDLFASKMRI